MSRPDRVHLVEPRRVDFATRKRDDWITACPTIQSERINPDTTTRDPERVTCGHCKRIAAKRAREKAAREAAEKALVRP